MTGMDFQQHWALWLAVAPLVVVASAVVAWAWRRSSRGRLGFALGEHRKALRAAARARRQHDGAKASLERLVKRAGKVKPRIVDEARGRLADQELLARIADDRVQVTANQLRKVIFEEYPPNRHEALRKRYLPGDVADGRPFTF
jgi:hypothetical protein